MRPTASRAPSPRRRAATMACLLIVLGGCSGSPGAGQTGGAAGSAEPLPASLSFTPGTEAAASGTVTLVDGGTISATASDGTTYELEVPPKAVAGDTEITMTPLGDVEGVTAEAGVSRAVQLEPEGQVFFDFVRLTITPANAMPVEEQLMFEARDDGSDPIAARVEPTSEEIVILLDHFSAAGVASATPEQRAVFMRKSAENAERRILGQLAERVQQERMRQLLGGSEDGPPEHSDLAEEFEREVVDRQRAAAEASCEGLAAYVRSVISFERSLQLLGMTEDEEAASLARVAEATAFAAGRYDECEREAIAECQEAEDPAILMAFWMSNERPVDEQRAEQLCRPEGLQFELTGTLAAEYPQGVPAPVSYSYWGLLCPESDVWLIWEEYEQQGVTIGGTGPPGEPGTAYEVAFDDSGAVTSLSHPQFPVIANTATAFGTTFALAPPGDEPTTVTAMISAVGGSTGDTTAPVEPADGSVAPCPESD